MTLMGINVTSQPEFKDFDPCLGHDEHGVACERLVQIYKDVGIKKKDRFFDNYSENTVEIIGGATLTNYF